MRPLVLICLGAAFAGATSCGSSSTLHERTQFSRTDSLTDIYLVLQDSLLQSWNRVIRYEIDRKEALAVMIDELQHSTIIDDEQTKAYHANLEQLERIRFTQKSMTDRHVIEEYDKALADLVNQLTSLSSTSDHLQPTVEEIEVLNQYNIEYRHYYDSVAGQFNSFIEVNWSDLKELGNSVTLDQKPLFLTVDNR